MHVWPLISTMGQRLCNKMVPSSFIGNREGGGMIGQQADSRRQAADLSSESPWTVQRKRWLQWRGVNKDEMENLP